MTYKRFSLLIIPILLTPILLLSGCEKDVMSHSASTVLSLFDAVPADHSQAPWRLIIYEHRPQELARNSPGLQCKGRRLSRRLVQAANRSRIRFPVSVPGSSMIHISLLFDGSKKVPEGTVEFQILNGDRILNKTRKPVKVGVVHGRLLCPPGENVTSLELVHEVPRNSALPIGGVSAAYIPASSVNSLSDRLDLLLDWLAHGSYDARGGFPESQIFPLSLGECTRNSAFVTSRDTLSLPLPESMQWDSLIYWIGEITIGGAELPQIHLEAQHNHTWIPVREDLITWKGEWKKFSVSKSELPQDSRSLRIRLEGRRSLAAFGEPLLINIHSPETTDIRKKKNLIVIDLDTLRPDRLGCYGYTERPTSVRLDSIVHEKGFVIFKNTHSASPWTMPSTAKFFSSRYLHEEMRNGVSSVSDSTPMLAEIMRDNGYYCIAFTGGSVLRTPGFDRGFHEYYWSTTSGKVEESFPRATTWLADHLEPFFLFLHTYESHGPLIRSTFCDDLPRGRLSDPADRKGLGIPSGSEVTSAESLYIEALYDGGVHAACEAVADLFVLLDARDLWQNTVVIILSDHGEEFWEHFNTYQTHGHSIYGEVLRVPFMIYYPENRDFKNIEEHVSLIDMMPTVANLLDLSWSGEADGENLLPLIHGSSLSRRIPILANMANGYNWYSRCVLANGMKYVETARKPGTENAPPRQGVDMFSGRELYDLENDPEEKRNLINDKSAQSLVAILSDTLISSSEKAYRPLRGETNSGQATMGETLRTQLEALGYVTDE